MRSATSKPTLRRRLLVGLFIGVGLCVGMSVKRYRSELALAGLDPFRLGGNAPDFLFTFGAMMFPMLSPAAISWKVFVRNSALIFVGCIAYEVSQIWTPGRTFDTRDIVAMAVGAAVALVLARSMFFESQAQES